MGPHTVLALRLWLRPALYIIIRSYVDAFELQQMATYKGLLLRSIERLMAVLTDVIQARYNLRGVSFLVFPITSQTKAT